MARARSRNISNETAGVGRFAAGGEVASAPKQAATLPLSRTVIMAFPSRETGTTPGMGEYRMLALFFPLRTHPTCIFQTISGTTNGLRYSRVSNWLASELSVNRSLL